MTWKRIATRFLRSDPIAFVPHFEIYDIDQAPQLWNIDNLVIEEQTKLWGWFLPHGGLLDNTKIVVNGLAFDPERMPVNGKFAELYAWHPNAAFSAFTVSIPHDVLDIPHIQEISISCVAKSVRGRGTGYSLDLLIKDLKFEMPPPELSARIGVTELLHYVMFGRSIFRGFERALAHNFKKGFADFSTIVDWGCGPARVARHTAAALNKGSKLIGFDIDAVAVDWANSHVGPYFKTCKTEPPLDLATASVDLVYAYSVLTHLSAEMLAIWITELARILRPGGLGMFTVLSDRAMITLQSALPLSELKRWKETGILDSAKNSDLSTIDVPDDYYRNVWVTRNYIKTMFDAQFEIVDFEGPFHFYQDLVIVRRL